MVKKYELLKDNTEIYKGRTLYRIRALRDIFNRFNPELSVSKGSLGGYIQSEDNLPQNDDSWVADNAMVFDTAELNDSWVANTAKVYGKVKLYGTEVYDNSYITGEEEVVVISSKVVGDSKIDCTNGYIKDTVLEDKSRISCCETKVIDSKLKYSAIFNYAVVISSVLEDNSYVEKYARVFKCNIKSSIIRDNANVINTSLNNNCIILNNAIVINSMLEDNVTMNGNTLTIDTNISHDSHIHNTSFVTSSRIKNTTITSSDTDFSDTLVNNTTISEGNVLKGVVDSSLLENAGAITNAKVINSKLKNVYSVADNLVFDTNIDITKIVDFSDLI